MTTLEHSVAAEDVMALLDGELSVAEAQAVTAHLEQCAQCAVLAEELRSTSQALSRWSVPHIPDEVEDSVLALAAEAAAGRKIAKPTVRFRGGFRGWKLLASGGGVALALFALAIFISPRLNRPSPMGEALVIRNVDRNHQSPSFQDKVRTAEPFYSRAPVSAGVAGMGSANGTLGELLTTPAPMIARAVSLTIVVKDVDAARSSLDSILAQNHGYAAQLNASRPENGSRSLLSSLRIPAGELQPAVDALKRLGRVESESQSGEEVSQQHADIVARLKTARETEERFQAILQQRTGKISDVLEVEQNIARLRGEIEAMESQQKALEHRVDYASVEVQLHEEYKARLDSGTISASTQMHNAFVAGYHHVTESLLGLVLFVEEYGPALVLWLVILGLPIVLVWRRYKRIRSAI